MNEPITKRLHVSGLTPALTPADLSARLSHFGTVKSLDGFGLPDGVGQPRKFGYVTLETTNGALKKCLSTLSGTTYKGAKLRIGEAKPDYTERFTKDPEPPAKKPRIHHNKFTGVPATDMSLITPENAATRPGWKVMPSGRVIRTMRMRPGKPLPPVPTDTKVLNTKEKERRRKKKAKDPDTRARSRTIDVAKWNGSYVTGVFLGESEVATAVSSRRPEVDSTVTVERPKDTKKEKRKEKEKLIRIEEVIVVPPPAKGPVLPAVAPSKAAIASIPSNSDLTDLSRERDQTISFLNSFLFSSKGGDTAPVDWDSDIELDEANVVDARNADDADEEYEVVPRDRQEDDGMDVDSNADAEPSSAAEEEEQVDEEGESSSSESDADIEMESTKTKPPPPKNALKDLFAPREDEGGFSLLNHLDLDLDDDLDLDMLPFPTSDSQTHYQPVVAPPTAPQPLPSTSRRQAQPLPLSQPTQIFTLDPKKPLFFPRPGSIAMFNATAGASSSSPFYQHQTPEEIQKRWEENKFELTKGWKKRHREAGKVRRRRGGGLDD